MRGGVGGQLQTTRGLTPCRLVGTSERLPSRALDGRIPENGRSRPRPPPPRGGASGWKALFLVVPKWASCGLGTTDGGLARRTEGRNRPRSSAPPSSPSKYTVCRTPRRLQGRQHAAAKVGDGGGVVLGSPRRGYAPDTRLRRPLTSVDKCRQVSDHSHTEAFTLLTAIHRTVVRYTKSGPHLRVSPVGT
eukprot:SAG22_NODE_952_length_6343_cov_3.567265_8_plen_190_part_00